MSATINGHRASFEFGQASDCGFESKDSNHVILSVTTLKDTCAIDAADLLDLFNRKIDSGLLAIDEDGHLTLV